MTVPVFCIRPEPGFSATMAAGRAMGLNMQGAPLFESVPVTWALPEGLIAKIPEIGSAEGSFETFGEGSPEIFAKGSAEGSPEKFAKGSAEGAPEKSGEGSTERPAKITPELAPEKAPKMAPELAPEKAPELAPELASKIPGGAQIQRGFGPCDALLLGSANALRHTENGAEGAWERLRQLPAYCVGAATAEQARQSGFAVAQTGGDGLQSLLNVLAERGGPSHFLRLTGRDHVPLTPHSTQRISQIVTYRMEPIALDSTPEHRIVDVFSSRVIVLLHSARAAEHFVRECARLDVDRSRISIAALSPRIAQAVVARGSAEEQIESGKGADCEDSVGRVGPAGWAQIASATCPQDAALLALAKAMSN